MNNINTSVLPVVKSEWQNQLNVLRLANETANNTVTSIQRQINKDAGLVSTLKPQLEKAQLSQWEAAQKYNSFIESGSQLLKVASDAEARLKNNNLSLFDRSQLVITRDNMINLASEFITFKSKNGASLQSLGPMNIGPKTYYSDGRVEWNTGLTSGMAGKVIENIGKVFTGIKEALLKGPLTVEENYAAGRQIA